MVSFPPCKINLGLHVIGKRPDGYHNLETCFYPVPWTDILEVIPANAFAFSSSGIEISGVPDQNLCVKAYQLLAREFSIDPVLIHLHKIIPMGAGLGGGSSDAAHVIRMLNEILGLNLSQEKMIQLAASIGSDTAFFIQDRPMLGTGRGEVLSDIQVDLQGQVPGAREPGYSRFHIRSICPGQAGGTRSSSFGNFGDDLLVEWKDWLKNDFEHSVFSKYPAIKELKDKLYSLGAMYASMSGSGATVFGIFKNEFNVANEFRDATVWASYL